MKKLFLSIGVLLFLAATGVAQKLSSNNFHEISREEARQMQAKLGLDSLQTVRVYGALCSYYKDLITIPIDLPLDQRSDSIKALFQSKEHMLQGILNASQWRIYRELANEKQNSFLEAIESRRRKRLQSTKNGNN